MHVVPETTPTPEERRVEYVPLDDLVPALRNPKAHDIPGLARSFGRHGLVEVPTIDERTGRLVAGHGRVETLVEQRASGTAPPRSVRVTPDGRWLVPTLRGWASTDDDDAESYLLASNQLAIGPGWDVERLAEMALDLGDRVDLTAIGWTAEQLDEITNAAASLAGESLPAPSPANPADNPAPPDEATVPVVTVPGDVWLLGPHRIMCGDARNPDHVDALLDGAVLNLGFTSPPYADRREYDESSGFRPIPPDEYVEWFGAIAANVAAHLAPDGSWFVNIKAASNGLDTETYVLDLVLAHVRRWGWHWATEFCWPRSGMPQGPSRRFKNQFEPVHQFARGEWKFRPDAVRVPSSSAITYDPSRNVVGEREQGDTNGRQAFTGSQVADGMAYPGNRLPVFGDHEATGHSAAFPVGLPEWFIRAYTDAGDRVFDPFMGSGSTLLAAHRQDRIGYGMELSPRYVDLILARFQRHTGIVPVRASTGLPVDFAPSDA